MAQQRKHIKHTQTSEERLEEEAQRYREAAEHEPPGSMARELLLRRAQKIEAASHLNQWLKVRQPGGTQDSIRSG